MREVFRVKQTLVAGIIVGTSLGVGGQESTDPVDASVPAAQGASPPAGPAEFGGTWDYNPLESINILTGRPEQAPRSATQGGGGRGGGVPPARPGGGGGGARGIAGGGFGTDRPSGGGGGSFGLGPTPEMLREQRDMSRDLLEVPEQYTIALAEGSIVFVDDLERERAYPLDGRKQKYRLGASEFNARVSWSGTQLRKDIEGAFGFRMSETYFLSPDAKRLFVIVRVGQPSRNRQPSGFNRVYDRIEPTPSPERVASN
jgi:hypothetical protein